LNLKSKTMKRTLLIIAIAVLTACGGVKKTQQAVNTGNYMTAINKALKNIRGNKTKKRNQSFVLLLEEAFAKHQQRELDRIAFLEKENNPNKLRAIYEGYVGLVNLQDQIKPLLPLPVYADNRNASFSFGNYGNDLLNAKDRLSAHLYDNADNLIKNANSKFDYRTAYDDLNYLNEINPGYANTVMKMEEAYSKGLDYVKVQVNNATEQIIPARLEDELLDFNTYGLDNFWTQYHARPIKDMRYDYAMSLDFREINISPERVNETQIIKEKVIKDGFDYVLDKNGNVAKDSLGNDIKVDKFKTVRCNFYQFTQLKTAQIGARVSFTNLANGQEINAYPLSSEYIFEHVYANYEGDRRALDNDLVALLDLAAVSFPTNEQMVYDAGEDLKARLKSIVNKYNFN